MIDYALHSLREVFNGEIQSSACKRGSWHSHEITSRVENRSIIWEAIQTFQPIVNTHPSSHGFHASHREVTEHKIISDDCRKFP